MTAKELQGAIEAAREAYTPGVPMDARVDQEILVGIVDGLGGGSPTAATSRACADGVQIGRELRKALLR